MQVDSGETGSPRVCVLHIQGWAEYQGTREGGDCNPVGLKIAMMKRGYACKHLSIDFRTCGRTDMISDWESPVSDYNVACINTVDVNSNGSINMDTRPSLSTATRGSRTTTASTLIVDRNIDSKHNRVRRKCQLLYHVQWVWYYLCRRSWTTTY